MPHVTPILKTPFLHFEVELISLDLSIEFIQCVLLIGSSHFPLVQGKITAVFSDLEDILDVIYQFGTCRIMLS